MIIVKTKLQRISNRAEDFSAVLFNAMVEQVAKETEKQVKAFECEKHPSSHSTLIVVAEKRGIKFDKSGFCCRELADRVEIKS